MDRRSSLSKEELEKQNQRKMSAMALMDTNKMNKTKPRNTFNTFFLSDSDQSKLVKNGKSFKGAATALKAMNKFKMK